VKEVEVGSGAGQTQT